MKTWSFRAMLRQSFASAPRRTRVRLRAAASAFLAGHENLCVFPRCCTFSSANALNVLRTLLGVRGDAKHGDYLESLLARYLHCT